MWPILFLTFGLNLWLVGATGAAAQEAKPEPAAATDRVESAVSELLPLTTTVENSGEIKEFRGDGPVLTQSFTDAAGVNKPARVFSGWKVTAVRDKEPTRRDNSTLYLSVDVTAHVRARDRGLISGIELWRKGQFLDVRNTCADPDLREAIAMCDPKPFHLPCNASSEQRVFFKIPNGIWSAVDAIRVRVVPFGRRDCAN